MWQDKLEREALLVAFDYADSLQDRSEIYGW